MKGILLASVVGVGSDGPRGILEYPSGFCNAYSAEPKLGAIIAGLGSSYEVMQDSIKSFPTIQCSHTAIEATIRIMDKHRLSAEEVEGVQIVQSETIKGQGCNYSPDTPLAARLSIPFCVALAVSEGRVTMDQFYLEKLKDKKISNIMSKVSVVQDPTLNSRYPETIASQVQIKVKGGKTYSDSAIHPKGDPRNRMTAEEVENKFRGLARNTFQGSRVESIIESVTNLEKAAGISELVDLLVK